VNAHDDRQNLAALLKGDLAAGRLDAEIQEILLLRGALAALEEIAQSLSLEDSQTETIWEAIYQAAAAHPMAEVRGQGQAALLRLAGAGLPKAADTLYRLAVEGDLLAARQAITANGWKPQCAEWRALFDWFTPSDTPYPEEALPLLTTAFFELAPAGLRVRILAAAPQKGADVWGKLVVALQLGTETAMQELIELYPRLRPVERDIALRRLETAADKGARPAKEALARLFIEYNEARAKIHLLESNDLPEDPEQRALFFFLAEAWDAYHVLDFDRRLLAGAYENAGRSLRRRILEHSRHTGQTEWLREHGAAGAGEGESRWIKDLTDADWEHVIARMDEQERWDSLWRLAQVAPPVWSAAILQQLTRRGWQPAGADEQAGFAELTLMAQECLAAPLEVRPIKQLYAPRAKIHSLALHPGGTFLAAGCGDQRILQWSAPDGIPHQPDILGPAAVTRALTYSPDGELLTCASGDNRIRIFKAKNGQLVKTMEGHTAVIRALAVHPNGRMLYSASFDGTARFWRFPHGAQLKEIHAGAGELFSLALGAEGSHLLTAGAGGQVMVWTLPEGAAARALNGHAGVITQVTTSPLSDLAASAGRDGADGDCGAIRLWNFTSGGLLRAFQTPGPITALRMHPNEQVLAGATASGEILWWNISTGKEIFQRKAHQHPVTGLVLAPEGDILYSADSDGTVLVWNFELFLSIRLPGERTRPGAAAALLERANKPDLSSPARKWLGFSAQLARWRQRFDIELAEIHTIPTGEFDIELG
jgi:WD40 repeat protein